MSASFDEHEVGEPPVSRVRQGALVLARALDDSRLFGQAMAEMTTRLLAKPD